MSIYIYYNIYTILTCITIKYIGRFLFYIDCREIDVEISIKIEVK